MPLAPKPDFSEQLILPRSMWYKLKSSYGAGDYRVMKSKREMPGTRVDHKGRTQQCGPNPRVKIRIPGVYQRICKGCKASYWFVLEQTQTWGVLRFRWVTEEEARKWLDEEHDGTVDSTGDTGQEVE